MTDHIEDEFVVVTEDVQEFKKGKVYTCECGQGHGVSYGEDFGRCPNCQKVLVDKRTGEREWSQDDTEQTTLGGW
jgi:hypothetical protein